MAHFRHPSPRENDDISVPVRKRGFWSPGRKGGIYTMYIMLFVHPILVVCRLLFILPKKG